MNRQGEIWFTEVDYSNNKGIKPRPVIIVANEHAVDIGYLFSFDVSSTRHLGCG